MLLLSDLHLEMGTSFSPPSPTLAARGLDEFAGSRYLLVEPPVALPEPKPMRPLAQPAPKEITLFPWHMTSLEDAERLVLHYELRTSDLGGGSAAGLAAFLFAPGRPVWGAWDLSKSIAEYKRHIVQAAGAGENFDAQQIREAQDVADVLLEHSQQRERLAELVRKTKLAKHVGLTWATIADLATAPAAARFEILKGASASATELREVLVGIEAHAAFLALPQKYEPGADPILDRMVRLDIAHLDGTLSGAAPWSAREDESLLEVDALRHLLRWVLSQ